MTKNRLCRFFIIFFIFSVIYLHANKKQPEIVFVLIPDIPSTVSKYVDGCRIVKLKLKSEPLQVENLSNGFYSAIDPDISLDGRKILFSARKKKEDHWQIWEMDMDGKNKKQLTSGPEDSFSPLYIGTLFHLNDKAPANRIAFIKKSSITVNDGEEFAVYTANSDGTLQTRITYNLSKITDIDVFHNGRILYNSIDLYQKDRRRTDLLAVNIDGTDNMGYFTDNVLSSLKGMVKIASNGRVYFIEAGSDAYLAGGRLSYVLEKRPLHTYNILNDGKKGFFHSPCPMADGNLLVSFRADKDHSYNLYLLDGHTGLIKKKIYSSDKFHSLDAQVSGRKYEIKGRSTFVNYKQKTGVFYCISSHISQHKVLREQPGSISLVKVYAGFYSKSTGIDSRLIGEAPVEKDGSFHIEVPSEKPLSFQLVGRDGKKILKQNSWTWVMPRESRGCIGCHEDRELSPPNVLPIAVLKPAVKISDKARSSKNAQGENIKK